MINASDLQGCEVDAFGRCLRRETHTQPFNESDLDWISATFNDTDALYMFVGNVSNGTADTLRPEQSGVRWYDANRDDTAWIAVFTHGQDLFAVNRSITGLSYADALRAQALKTAAHELGHVLNMGEADDEDFDGDGDLDEVYSGCPTGCNHPDPTVERVNDTSIGRLRVEWSVMSSGAEIGQYLPPTYEVYFAFSIKELLTVTTADTQVT